MQKWRQFTRATWYAAKNRQLSNWLHQYDKDSEETTNQRLRPCICETKNAKIAEICDPQKFNPAKVKACIVSLTPVKSLRPVKSRVTVLSGQWIQPNSAKQVILSAMSNFLDTSDNLMDNCIARERNLGMLQVSRQQLKDCHALEAQQTVFQIVLECHTLVLDMHANSVHRRIGSYSTDSTSASVHVSFA